MIRIKAHTPILDLSLEVASRSLVVLYGPSGSGKTTLLRMVAGLARSGFYLEVDGEVWDDPLLKIHRPPQQRGIGMVFQDYALFPHLSVRENLALANGSDAKRIDYLIDALNLAPLADRKPARLSGGQQQRAALARALARRPRLLLLDEPLSAQDDVLRARLQGFLLDIHRTEGLTTLLVTHDRQEAARLADTVVSMADGRVTGQGAPREVWGGRGEIY
ncbi:ABC transporter ATP-binding protein [Dinghuibacter silviterrae]|uniref:Molybdate transport system ATP-binding protein n=1 Tax=Dinghuibacter silviterrae TaxID=1539049 RepID=A0A4V3GLY1_9BACT|nr:ATP-binding cassette domain-containing protein [Dinghuibacter silviterrae]TDX01313.1 molybdate transport system ATP-binding protein [Dinghuibacter silviterrae]